VILQGPQQPLPAGGQLYEITLEDAPRSATGRPTGPILVKGFATIPPA
jgi:anti-sigma-K factor RskA